MRELSLLALCACACVATARRPAPVRVDFDLTRVRGAASARCTLLGTGETVAAARPPCTFAAQASRPPAGRVRIDYLSSAGNVLKTSERGYPERAPNFSHISASIYNYSSGDLPEDLRKKVLPWQARRFDLVVGGAGDVRPYNPSVVWSGYIDFAGVYADQAYDMKDFAARYGFPWEDAWAHSSADYNVPAHLAWKDMEQFDAFEKASWAGNYSFARNGVLIVNGSRYRDVTVAAFDNAEADVRIDGRLLIGYAEPFAEVNFVLAAGAERPETQWEYWNGDAWMTLSLAGDDTGGLERSGRVWFTPPSGWKPRQENASRSKYWVRVSANGGKVPVASRIFGESWNPGGGSNARGWAAGHPNIVNAGLGPLEFNPSPPDGATARFRYQARATGIWAPNTMFGNPAAVHEGSRIWAVLLSDKFLLDSDGKNYDGLMFDNGGAGPPIPHDKLDIPQDRTWAQFAREAYTEARQRLESAVPGLQVGANTVNLDFGSAGTWLGTENQYYAWLPWPYYDGRAAGDITFDRLMPDSPTNPGNTRGYLMCMDTVPVLPTPQFYANWHYWDRGNRGPMLCLAMHYIGANPNTGFTYNSVGFYYTETDEFYHYSDPAQTSGPVGADKSGTEKTIALGSASTFPANASGTFRISEGDRKEGDIVEGAVRDGALVTRSPIYNSYAEGARVSYVLKSHQAADPLPPLSRIHKWSPWFPAIGVDVGSPDPDGWKHGARDMEWIAGAAASSLGNCPAKGRGCSPVWRRDYTRAMVLMRPYLHEIHLEEEIDRPSKPIDLGGTYYPLTADGATGPAVTSVTLRAGEGAILMKSPVDRPR